MQFPGGLGEMDLFALSGDHDEEMLPPPPVPPHFTQGTDAQSSGRGDRSRDEANPRNTQIVRMASFGSLKRAIYDIPRCQNPVPGKDDQVRRGRDRRDYRSENHRRVPELGKSKTICRLMPTNSGIRSDHLVHAVTRSVPRKSVQAHPGLRGVPERRGRGRGWRGRR